MKQDNTCNKSDRIRILVSRILYYAFLTSIGLPGLVYILGGNVLWYLFSALLIVITGGFFFFYDKSNT